jgi:hypothetical protein
MDYIRVLEGAYFLTEFSPHFANRVLGNGVPYGRDSEYYRFVSSLGEREGYYLSDVGMIAVYAMFGVVAVVAYALVWMKSFVLEVPKEYGYVRYYLWFLLATSLTSATVYELDYLVATVLALYVFQVEFLRSVRVESKSAGGDGMRLAVRC